jgi:hypothetical protein
MKIVVNLMNLETSLLSGLFKSEDRIRILCSVSPNETISSEQSRPKLVYQKVSQPFT